MLEDGLSEYTIAKTPCEERVASMTVINPDALRLA